MSSFARAEHLSQHYVMDRVDRAQVSFQHMEFTMEPVERLARRIVSVIKPAVQRWAAAHHQAVADRLFWELALSDARVMSDLRAMKDHAGQ